MTVSQARKPLSGPRAGWRIPTWESARCRRLTEETGAAIAVGCAIILRGRGGDPISHAAGSGVLTPGRLAEKNKLSQQIDDGKVAPPGLDQTSSPGGSQPRQPPGHVREC